MWSVNEGANHLIGYAAEFRQYSGEGDAVNQNILMSYVMLARLFWARLALFYLFFERQKNSIRAGAGGERESS